MVCFVPIADVGFGATHKAGRRQGDAHQLPEWIHREGKPLASSSAGGISQIVGAARLEALF
jgi:hypothetical protein